MPLFDFNAFGAGFPALNFLESELRARDRDESYTALFELELLPGNIGYPYVTDFEIYYQQLLEIPDIGTFLDWHLIDSPPAGLTVSDYDDDHLTITGTPSGAPGFLEFAVQVEFNGHNVARRLYRMWIGRPLFVDAGAYFSGIILHQSAFPFFGAPPYIARGTLDGVNVFLYDSLLEDSPKEMETGLGVIYRKNGASPAGVYEVYAFGPGGEPPDYPATVTVSFV